MQSLKTFLRRGPLGAVYLWLANGYRATRRLFIYPETARIGVVDYDVYWDIKAGKKMGVLSPFRRARADVFIRILPQGAKVLDLGCGDGAVLGYLVEKRGIDAYGLDISQQAVDFCRAQGLHVDLADINQPIGRDVADHYDAIIMSEIIEHIPDPERLLDSLRDRADLLIVSIPNTGFYQHRLRLLLGRFPLQWVVTPGEHLRFWTLTDFRWWAQQMGFRIVHQEAYMGTPGLRRWWPTLFGQGMVYALKNTRSPR
ncbi:MAG: methyltransferase domain-containing protein [Anaerolineae bacterium]|nr:methyltransferase domain-containing protein [Anaerolineae bacterium]